MTAFIPRWVLLALLLIGVLSSARSQDRAKEKPLSALQGSWTAVEAELGGALIEDAAFWREKKTFKLKESAFQLVLADSTFEGTAQINAETNPQQITFVTKGDTELRGIYALKDDRLTLCWAVWIKDKRPAERPTGFATRKEEFKFVFRKDAEPQPEKPAADAPESSKLTETKKSGPDSVAKVKLERAKMGYESDLNKLRTKLLAALERKENDARKDGNKKLVDQIEADRKTLDELQLLPQSIPTREFEVGVKKAREEMKSAYAAAIKDFTRQRLDAEAQRTEQELNLFLAEEFNFQGSWRVRHASGWTGVRTVQRDRVIDDPKTKQSEIHWKRTGTTIHVIWPGGGGEHLAIDPKNPSHLEGEKGVKWDRIIPPQKKK